MILRVSTLLLRVGLSQAVSACGDNEEGQVTIVAAVQAHNILVKEFPSLNQTNLSFCLDGFKPAH